jgi:hypothetical protein
LDLEARYILDRDYVQSHRQKDVFLYIFQALFYALKNKGYFSKLDEDLWIYETLNFEDMVSILLFSSLN